MKKIKIERSEILLDLIMKSDLKTIEGNNVLHIDQKPLDVKFSTFLHNLQHPTKKINIKNTQQNTTTFLNALDVSPSPLLVAITYAKKVLEFSFECEQVNFTQAEKNPAVAKLKFSPEKR